MKPLLFLFAIAACSTDETAVVQYQAQITSTNNILDFAGGVLRPSSADVDFENQTVTWNETDGSVVVEFVHLRDDGAIAFPPHGKRPAFALYPIATGYTGAVHWGLSDAVVQLRY